MAKFPESCRPVSSWPEPSEVFDLAFAFAIENWSYTSFSLAEARGHCLEWTFGSRNLDICGGGQVYHIGCIVSVLYE